MDSLRRFWSPEKSPKHLEKLLRVHAQNEREKHRKVVEERERKQPWKYIGYKVFSRWMASDQTFFILRRFGALNARVALSLQDEIVELEEKLNFMDKEYSSTEWPDVNNGSFRDDPFANIQDDRGNLVRNTLPEKLAKYSKYEAVHEEA